MRNSFILYFFLVCFLASCASANHSFKKGYRKSQTIAVYSGMTNELQDGYLVLKENGYFKFYETVWILFNLKLSGYKGRYVKQNDTLYLNWRDTDPKTIKYYLSGKCVIEKEGKSLWFIHEWTGERLWGMGLDTDK